MNNSYFNFPVKMMQGVLREANKARFLKDLLFYHLQTHNENINNDDWDNTDFDKFKMSADYYGFKLFDAKAKYQRATYLVDHFSDAKVFTGIYNKIFFDFFRNNKTDFEWECLFAFLALRSILGSKSYCKSNNGLLYARMSGNESNIKNEHSLEFSRFRRDKIINALEDNWSLKYYSRYTKGFWFGFDVNLKDLILKAEQNRKSNKELIRKNEKSKALKEALEILKVTAP